MNTHLAVMALLLTLSTACGTARVVRLDTGQGEPILHVPTAAEVGPVRMEESAFRLALSEQVRRVPASANPEHAARELFDVPERSGWYGFNKRQGLVAQDDPPPASAMAQADVELTQDYLRWCSGQGTPGDCRKLLVNSPVITGDGRYALAMAFAMEEVLPEMMLSFKDMADPEAIKASLIWTMTIYVILWTVPEPISKGLAAVLTATVICYLGVDSTWTLIAGWRRLVEQVDHATTFSQVREVGEKYGKVMGKNAARAFALLVSAAIGQTASGFAAKVPRLPGSAQASVQASTQAGIRLTAVSQVDAVAVSTDAVTMALSPQAVSSTVRGLHGAAGAPADEEGIWHHIATDKWLKGRRSGGPWTPRFQEIFDRAGMSLNDPANKVRLKGHKGPHPQEYHEEVYRRLDEATTQCRSIQSCGQALEAELRALAEEISTPGTWLNRLVTRSA